MSDQMSLIFRHALAGLVTESQHAPSPLLGRFWILPTRAGSRQGGSHRSRDSVLGVAQHGVRWLQQAL